MQTIMIADWWFVCLIFKFSSYRLILILVCRVPESPVVLMVLTCLSVSARERERERGGQAASGGAEPVCLSVSVVRTDWPASSDRRATPQYCQELKRCLWRNTNTNETFYPPVYCWRHWTPLDHTINTTNFRWTWYHFLSVWENRFPGEMWGSEERPEM